MEREIKARAFFIILQLFLKIPFIWQKKALNLASLTYGSDVRRKETKQLLLDRLIPTTSYGVCIYTYR
jgi:hypothetical protein